MSGVRPVSVRPAGGSLQDCDVIYGPSSPNLEHTFYVPWRRKCLWSSSTGSSIRACATINRLPLTNVVFGYIWGLISPKQFKIWGGVNCQWNTNRKSHTASRMVTCPMTSPDPERSRSWPDASKLTDFSYTNFIVPLYREWHWTDV